MYCSSNFRFFNFSVLKPLRTLFGKRQHTIALYSYIYLWVLPCLEWSSSELIAMKHKRNYTVEVYLFIYLFIFILRIRERKLVRCRGPFRSRNFHAMYLAAGSFVFAWDAAEPQSLKLLKSSTKEQPCKRIKYFIGIFLEWKYVLRMFSFLAPKAPGIRDCCHQSRGCH